MRNSFHAHAVTQSGLLSISFESRPYASPTPQWWAVIQLTWVVYTQMERKTGGDCYEKQKQL